jgi:hypothetical protein
MTAFDVLVWMGAAVGLALVLVGVAGLFYLAFGPDPERKE